MEVKVYVDPRNTGEIRCNLMKYPYLKKLLPKLPDTCRIYLWRDTLWKPGELA